MGVKPKALPARADTGAGNGAGNGPGNGTQAVADAGAPPAAQ